MTEYLADNQRAKQSSQNPKPRKPLLLPWKRTTPAKHRDPDWQKKRKLDGQKHTSVQRSRVIRPKAEPRPAFSQAAIVENREKLSIQSPPLMARVAPRRWRRGQVIYCPDSIGRETAGHASRWRRFSWSKQRREAGIDFPQINYDHVY